MCKQCAMLGSCPAAKQRNFERCDSFTPVRYDQAQLFQMYLKVEEARQKAKEAQCYVESLETTLTDMTFIVMAQDNKDEVFEAFKQYKNNHFND